MCYVLYGDDLSLLCYTILAMMVAFPHVAIVNYDYTDIFITEYIFYNACFYEYFIFSGMMLVL